MGTQNWPQNWGRDLAFGPTQTWANLQRKCVSRPRLVAPGNSRKPSGFEGQPRRSARYRFPKDWSLRSIRFKGSAKEYCGAGVLRLHRDEARCAVRARYVFQRSSECFSNFPQAQPPAEHGGHIWCLFSGLRSDPECFACLNVVIKNN